MSGSASTRVPGGKAASASTPAAVSSADIPLAASPGSASTITSADSASVGAGPGNDEVAAGVVVGVGVAGPALGRPGRARTATTATSATTATTAPDQSSRRRLDSGRRQDDARARKALPRAHMAGTYQRLRSGGTGSSQSRNHESTTTN